MKDYDFCEISKKILDTMEEKAKAMGVVGVAVICSLEDVNSVNWITNMRVVGKYRTEPNQDNKGYNFIGVAYAKACEMMDTHQNSGSKTRPILIGELGYKGGKIIEHEGGYVVAAFSGASSEEDFEISSTGLDVLKK